MVKTHLYSDCCKVQTNVEMEMDPKSTRGGLCWVGYVECNRVGWLGVVSACSIWNCVQGQIASTTYQAYWLHRQKQIYVHLNLFLSLSTKWNISFLNIVAVICRNLNVIHKKCSNLRANNNKVKEDHQKRMAIHSPEHNTLPVSFSWIQVLAHWPVKHMSLSNHKWQMIYCLWTHFRWSHM